MALVDIHKKSGLTQTAVARAASIDAGDLSRALRRGYRLTMPQLERLAEAYGVPVAELVL